MKKVFLILVVIAISTSLTKAQSSNHDPKKVEVFTSDITHFWEAYDALPNYKNKDSILQALYFDRASMGLKKYLKGWKITTSKYLKLIASEKIDWESIRYNSTRIALKKDSVFSCLETLLEIYPKANFPNIHIFIGCFNFNGLARDEVWIGAEKLSYNTNIATIAVIVHEYVHEQQKKSGNRLYQRALNEGAADFICEKICGTIPDLKRYEYGDVHEETLWKKFELEMKSKDVSNWLNQGHNSGEAPPDLGYYMGYKICESYYNNATDKKQALIDIVAMKKYKSFFKKSQYALKFKN